MMSFGCIRGVPFDEGRVTRFRRRTQRRVVGIGDSVAAARHPLWAEPWPELEASDTVRLLAPRGAHERGHGVFPPALVDLLTDEHDACSAEVVGGWFIVYLSPHKELDEQRWRHLFELARVLASQPAAR